MQKMQVPQTELGGESTIMIVMRMKVLLGDKNFYQNLIEFNECVGSRDLAEYKISLNIS